MRTINSPAKKAIIAKAELHLKRPLIPKEITVVAGFDDFPAKVFAEEWTGCQIVELLAERTRPDDPVLMLESLARAGDVIASALDRLISFQKGRARKAAMAFPFDTAMAGFSLWLLRLLDAHKLPAQTRVLKFGLFEQSRVPRLYVSGCTRYDKESDDWASQVDWWKDDHVTELSELSTLWRNLTEAKAEPWITVQAMTILMIREFFEKHEAEFREITRLNSVAVATGFDDGDLYEVQTTISPKT
jgi:hypothetical protein